MLCISMKALLTSTPTVTYEKDVIRFYQYKGPYIIKELEFKTLLELCFFDLRIFHTPYQIGCKRELGMFGYMVIPKCKLLLNIFCQMI